ncbi:MAG: MFS transporter [Anaerolineales bacterium]|nr:MFS transporter [Anaerolineales bacterium]
MTESKPTQLSFWFKLAFGAGEFGPSSIGMMRSLFYVIYLTDTVGLDPQLASLGAMIGLIWDSINDPLVGMFSDRVQTRWGRRRPFLLFFSIPFGITSVLLWTAPNWESEIALTVYVTVAFMLVDTFGTLLSVPYLSLIPDLTRDYDERTSLAGFKTAFQLIGSLSVVIATPMLVDAAIEAGFPSSRGVIQTATVLGVLSALMFLVVFFSVRERHTIPITEEMSIPKMLKLAWRNIPFRFVAGIFLLNWTILDMVAVVFPFYLLYWIAEGDMLVKAHLFGVDLALESAFFGALMLVTMISVPFWMWLSKRRNKQHAYTAGMLVLASVLLAIFFVQPGQIDLLLVLGALAGFGVASAYVLPDAMFPDIIEWDELRARQRQEGIYYGARAFLRKLATALVIFFVLQLLGLSGYQNPPIDSTFYQQPESALLTIRILISVVGGGLLLLSALIAWFNPLTREKNARIQSLLERRKNKSGAE